MSADNIAICPVCLMTAREEYARIQKDLRGKYGKISQEEYEDLQLRAAANIRPGDYRTLAEYAEFYLKETFEFAACYSAKCDVCGFEHSFNHKETINQKGE